MRALRAGVVYFALVFGAGFVLGALRVGLLVPRLGVRTAELLEMPVMFCVIFFAAGWLNRRLLADAGARVRLAAGAVALAIAIGAELLLAVAIQKQSPADFITSRDPVSGSVFLAMLIVFALMPALRTRRG